jgi:hypothetical protein
MNEFSVLARTLDIVVQVFGLVASPLLGVVLKSKAVNHRDHKRPQRRKGKKHY